MITWTCPGCHEPEWSRYGDEARDLIAHHKQHCPDHRGINFLKEKTR